MVSADRPNVQTFRLLPVDEAEGNPGVELPSRPDCSRTCHDAQALLAGDSAAWQVTASGLAQAPPAPDSGGGTEATIGAHAPKRRRSVWFVFAGLAACFAAGALLAVATSQ